jgi:hypothetical protein
VIALLFTCIGGSVMPAALVHSELMDPASRLWVVGGRTGPAIFLAIVVWLACYTLLAIAIKWLLLGRQRAGVLKPRGSFAFYRWWAVQRIWAVWDASAGPFLLDTPLINVVYMLLGARVSQTRNS